MNAKRTQTRARIDWEVWAPKVIAKELGVREAARQLGCSDAAVRKAVDAYRKRNVTTDGIRRKTVAKLEAPILREAATPGEVEDAIATRAAAILEKHRDRIERTLLIVEALTTDLTSAVVMRDRLEKLVAKATQGDPLAFAQLTSGLQVSEQAKAAGTLAGALRTLIGLQRQAFELPATVSPDGKGPKGKASDSALAESLADMMRDLNGADTGLNAPVGAATGVAGQ